MNASWDHEWDRMVGLLSINLPYGVEGFSQGAPWHHHVSILHNSSKHSQGKIFHRKRWRALKFLRYSQTSRHHRISFPAPWFCFRESLKISLFQMPLSYKSDLAYSQDWEHRFSLSLGVFYHQIVVHRGASFTYVRRYLWQFSAWELGCHLLQSYHCVNEELSPVIYFYLSNQHLRYALYKFWQSSLNARK